ncbi:uncharacterized oxidoreductase ZK1290.5-like [Gadus chalcogrammus]|uniref:uncharacterized oxidoreductase ZK1290.5-like n=1 Tax=Gadus chalcogrammus TaxID=1042646 RepID=UPI0024C4B607|nr:uncharacterized oxidoreductase ZK1290.5-like [Gadus chalcogrammus]XP_056452242.1 uncharacterized oxidoreductase ZK1290.5-like [Gadus chalcogrammus]
MASSVFPKVTLSNGLQIPILGLGTSHRGGYSHEAILHALKKCGVRHIDTAKRYGCEEQLGTAIRKSGVPRSDLWLTNKLWHGDYGYKAAKQSCLDSCSRMGVDYFDLYLMHWPEGQQNGLSNREVRAGTWRALQELYDQGVCRAIGVSNFLVPHLEQLKEDCSVLPHVNQVEYHVYQQPRQLVEYCREEGIVFQGYSPLAKGQALGDPTVLKLAEKYGRTPAQICIRWSIQNGVVTIPKSTKKERIEENCQVMCFQMDEEDMAALGKLHDGRHVSWDPTHVK